MPSRIVPICAFTLLSLFAACSSNDATSAGAPPPEVPAGCNPIVGADCLGPYPSAFYERADSTSATGVRVAFPDGVLPNQASGTALSSARMNQKDGFSAATPFVVYFAEGVERTQLGGWKDPSASLDPASNVQVIDFDTQERVLAFAELDDQVQNDTQRQALLIHPLVRLKSGHRYIVALVGLQDAAGKPLAPAPFRALRDKTPLSSSLKAVQSRYEDLFAALAKAGVDRKKLSLAWDVVIASDETATGHLVGMRDAALALLDQGKLGYAIKQVTPTIDAHNHALIDATVKVPSYLKDDSGTSMMNFGADGKPAMRAIVDVPIVISIPKCAETATSPVPVVVFGHGLFGNARDTIGGSAVQAAGDQLCSVFVGTDWIGLSSADLKTLPDSLTSDLNNLYLITDRLQQAQLNALTMTRMFLTKIKDDAALQINGKPVSDGKEVYYFGVSNGGIQGTTFMGLTPDIVRGVLNVPGSEWSLMIFRSADIGQFGKLLGLLIPDLVDRQVALAFSQSEWDYTDPATFAPHLITSPLPGVPQKRILVQESIGDAQVPNVSTRVLARTMGLSGFDLVEPVPGVPVAKPPLDSAYTQWNSHKTPIPPLDDTALPKDNGAHDSVWASQKALDQIGQFCKPNGAVVSVCNGPCNIP
jgi:hypothetical protein